MHKKFKQYIKKSAAIFTAAALTLTASSAIVFGAGSYQEEEKKAFSKSLETLPKMYDNVLQEYKDMSTGAEMDFSIQLEDAGRSMLSLFVPADLSWLNKMDMQTKVIFKDGVEGVDMNLLLNDTQIMNLQTYLDFSEQFSFMKLPELFDGYLKSSMNSEAYAGDDEAASVYNMYSSEPFQNYINAMMNISAYLPEYATLETLLERYGNMVIDHISDTSSGEEVLTLEEITENCKVYEGRINQEELYTLAEDILNTAKEDAELKEILDTWQELSPGSENLYEGFLKEIEKVRTDLGESKPDAEKDSYISSKIWVSEDDAIIGRQISFVDSTGTNPVITWQMPQENGKFEYLLDFASGSSSFSMTGNGNIDGNIMSGTYYVYFDSQPVISIEMQDYDVAAAKEGYGKGIYTITPLPGIADEETYSILSNFSLIAEFESEKNNSTIALSLLSAGSVLVTIKMDMTIGSDMVIPEITDSDTVYDTAVEEDSTAFAEAVSYDKILDNLRKAGVPEDMVAQLQASMEADNSLADNEDMVLPDSAEE